MERVQHLVFSSVYETSCPRHGIREAGDRCTCRGSWQECSDFPAVTFSDGRVSPRAVVPPNGFIHYQARCAAVEESPCAVIKQ